MRDPKERSTCVCGHSRVAHRYVGLVGWSDCLNSECYTWLRDGKPKPSKCKKFKARDSEWKSMLKAVRRRKP